MASHRAGAESRPCAVSVRVRPPPFCGMGWEYGSVSCFFTYVMELSRWERRRAGMLTSGRLQRVELGPRITFTALEEEHSDTRGRNGPGTGARQPPARMASLG